MNKIIGCLVFIFQLSVATADTINLEKRMAGHPATSAEKLWDLFKSKDWEVRETLGRNRKSPIELLDKLADDENMHVRIAVATNLSTTEKIFEKLAKDEEVEVRSVVARFEYIPERILAILANDDVVDIRLEVARNLNTTKATLHKLVRDTHLEVSQIAQQRITQEQ